MIHTFHVQSSPSFKRLVLLRRRFPTRPRDDDRRDDGGEGGARVRNGRRARS